MTLLYLLFCHLRSFHEEMEGHRAQSLWLKAHNEELRREWEWNDEMVRLGV